MKIAVAHDAMDGAGGVETYLARLIPALQARGHAVALLCRRSGTGADRIGVDLLVDVEGKGVDAAFRELRRWGADVCFSHNMAPLDVERRALAEWPVVKMMHGYFGTCVSGLKTHAFPSMQSCDRVLGGGCLALYAPRRCGPLHPVKLLNGYRWAAAQRALLPQYAALVVASSHMGREYSRHGVDRERLNVLPLFSTVSADGDRTEGTAVLFLGRMTTLKGGQLLIQAMAEVNRRLRRRVPLIVAGTGPQQEEWRRLAASLDVDAEFPGWIEGSARSALFHRVAVLVVPSVWPEPFGLVGLEAATFGIPAVAFDVGGIREWLRHDVTGRIVHPADGAGGLAAEIAALLSDEGSRRRLGEGAREAAKTMSLDAHVSRLEYILERAASRRV